jgi:hypothetical protein
MFLERVREAKFSTENYISHKRNVISGGYIQPSISTKKYMYIVTCRGLCVIYKMGFGLDDWIY